MGYVDVGKDGPIVIEVPPKLQGILDDFWQRPITGPTIDGHTFAGDVGFAGPDKGEGGKYLLLPPGYQGEVPAGYFAYRSRTNNIFVFWRAFFRDPAQTRRTGEADRADPHDPLGKKDSAKPMQFPDASGVSVRHALPIGRALFRYVLPLYRERSGGTVGCRLARHAGSHRHRKGEPFKPDDRSQAILNSAAKTAFKTSKVVAFDLYPARPEAHIWKDRQWTSPVLGLYSKAGPQYNYDFLASSGAFRDLDARVNMFTNYYSTSPGMMVKKAGAGAAYLVGFRDRDKKLYDGSQTYVLRLPAGIPAKDFWSSNSYDALTASGLDNG